MLNEKRAVRAAIPYFAVVLLAAAAGCSKPKPVPGYVAPITVERLVGRRLADIKQKQISWRFDATTVTIDNNGDPLPQHILDDLQLQRDSCKQIKAAWSLSASNDRIAFTEFEIDGEATAGEATVAIEPAGPIRANLGSRQYNILRE